MNSQSVKEKALALGAVLVGITDNAALAGAPEGFGPTDVLPTCHSAIAFALPFPASTLHCPTGVPYTVARNTLSAMVDTLALELCLYIEQEGYLAVPTGAIGPTEFDTRTDRYRNVISAKHVAQAAGLGVIGRNTLLITPAYGNMVWLGVVLTDARLTPDQPLSYDYCANCYLCEDVCPVHAVGEPELKQTTCSSYCFGSENGGEWKIKCYRCRAVCPYCVGEKNLAQRPNKLAR